MRSLVLVGLLAFATPALADNFVVASSPTPFNRINLFMDTPGPTFVAPPAPLIASAPSAAWASSLGPGNTSLQLQSPFPPASTLVAWNQTYVGAGASYQLSYQVGVFDGSVFTLGYSGQLTLSPGGIGIIAPVPEPSSMLICGLGLGALGVRACRRKWRGPPRPPQG